MNNTNLIPLQGEIPLFRDNNLTDFDVVSNEMFLKLQNNLEAVKNSKYIIQNAPEHLQLISQKKDFKKGKQAALNLAKKDLNFTAAPPVTNDLSKRLKSEYKGLKPKMK